MALLLEGKSRGLLIQLVIIPSGLKMDYSSSQLNKCIFSQESIVAANLRDQTSSSKVYEVLLKKDGKIEKVAIKLYTKGSAPPAILSHLAGRTWTHLVRINKVGMSKPAFVSMEFCPNDLRELIKAPSPSITAEEITRLLKEIALGMLSLKSLKMMHGDLKPQNILLDQQGSIKIADLDFVLREEEFLHRKMRVGTLQYMAPEVLSEWRCSYASDVWSVGVLLYELYFGCCPFPEIEQLDPSKENSILNAYVVLQQRIQPLRKKITAYLKQSQSSVVQYLLSTMLRCLVWSVNQRATAQQLSGAMRTRKGSWSTDYTVFHHEDDIFMFPNTGLLLALQQLRNILSSLPEETSKYRQIVECFQSLVQKQGREIEEIKELRTMIEVKYRKLERNFERLSKMEGGIGYSNKGQLFNHLNYLRELLSEEEKIGLQSVTRSAEHLP